MILLSLIVLGRTVNLNLRYCVNFCKNDLISKVIETYLNQFFSNSVTCQSFRSCKSKWRERQMSYKLLIFWIMLIISSVTDYNHPNLPYNLLLLFSSHPFHKMDNKSCWRKNFHLNKQDNLQWTFSVLLIGHKSIL